jgi:hypothetical protein
VTIYGDQNPETDEYFRVNAYASSHVVNPPLPSYHRDVAILDDDSGPCGDISEPNEDVFHAWPLQDTEQVMGQLCLNDADFYVYAYPLTPPAHTVTVTPEATLDVVLYVWAHTSQWQVVGAADSAGAGGAETITVATGQELEVERSDTSGLGTHYQFTFTPN